MIDKKLNIKRVVIQIIWALFYKFQTVMDTLKKIGKYKYGQRHCLGEGSFGKVYEGVDQSGRKVAIKKIQQRMIATDPYLKQSLSTQIAIMKKLKHRNIVELIDTVATANSIYLILEHCSGGDLKRYSLNKRFGEEQALKILKQLIQGFYVIVSEGIIHRDLKPANVLVHEGTFKICDFGFAKYFGQMNKMAKTCVGTPIYMSPQVLKQRPYTAKSDIWSLGVMYYELLFGKIPYLGKSEEQIFKLITRGKLSIPKCSQQSYLFLINAMVIEEQNRWDWNKVFQHFGIRSNKQKPGFYQNLVNLFKPNEQLPEKKIIKNSHSKSRDNRQNRNNSFKERVNFQYGGVDSPQKQQGFTPKHKPGRFARNILAQDDLSYQNQPHHQHVVDQQHRFFEPNIHLPEPQKVQQGQQRLYTPAERCKVRVLYKSITHFMLKEQISNYSSRISSFQFFLYSLVTLSRGEYLKQLSPGNIKQLNKLARIVLQQERDTLQKLLLGMKIFQKPYSEIKSIASIMQLQGKGVFSNEDLSVIEQLRMFSL